MMDVSSMYGNHHPHHSNTYHAGAAGVPDVSTVAANGYPNAYFPNSSVMTHGALHHQPNHHLNSGYTSYDGSSPNYYQQQQIQQPQQPQQLTPPPSQPSGHSHPLYSQSHSHLFSPTAAEYGITTSNTLAAATPSHPTNASHSPSEALYYENESVHAYYATAAVATVPPATTNSPITAANATTAAQNVPLDPPIISSENGLSYTNLDCLYNQNSPHQHSSQATYMPAEEKYASVLHSQYTLDDTLMHLTANANNPQTQQHSPQLWHHQHHMTTSSYAAGTLDASGLPMDSYNMHPHFHAHNIPHQLPPQHNQGNSQLVGPQSLLQHHSPTSTSCPNQNSRTQNVVSPGGTTTSTTSTSSSSTSNSCSNAGGNSSNNSAQAKSPNHGNNLPTYKWMQLKRNVPKPQDENIRQKIINLLHAFNLDLNDNAIIVTDRGSNMVAAFRNSNHIYCIDHLLHNTVQKSIQEVSEVAELSSLCTKLVKYFKISGLNSKLPTTLKSFSPTRWNSIYNLFVSIKANWSDIIQCLQQKDELNRISNINIRHVSELITLLESFENTFKKLEGENYPTIHLVYLHINLLKKKCSADVADEQITKLFKEKLSGYLNTIVLQNLTIYHKIAVFLYPPLNKLVQFNGDEQIQIKNKCKCILTNYLEDDGEIETQSRDVFGISNENIELMSDFLPQAQNPITMNKVDSEIFKYESLNVTFYDEFNILQWWEINKKEFPLLFKLSCKILATPASSAASERVFSAARNLITEKRCKIASNDDIINETMFLHSNIPKSDLQNELSRTDILNNDIM